MTRAEKEFMLAAPVYACGPLFQALLLLAGEETPVPDGEEAPLPLPVELP